MSYRNVREVAQLPSVVRKGNEGYSHVLRTGTDGDTLVPRLSTGHLRLISLGLSLMCAGVAGYTLFHAEIIPSIGTGALAVIFGLSTRVIKASPSVHVQPARRIVWIGDTALPFETLKHVEVVCKRVLVTGSPSEVRAIHEINLLTQAGERMNLATCGDKARAMEQAVAIAAPPELPILTGPAEAQD